MSVEPDTSLKILVAESDRIVARDVELTLERYGFQVVGTPADLEKAEEMVAAEGPDLVLLSVDFSDDSGVEFGKKLRQDHKLPVIFLTGDAEDTVFEAIRASRPVGYVRKPFSGAELVSSIHAAAQRIEPDQLLAGKLPWVRSLIDPMDDSIVVSGMDGRVVLMNKAAQKLTGWSEKDAIGAPYSKVVPTTHQVGDANGAKDKDKKGSNGSGSACQIVDRQGQQHTVRTITSPLREEAGSKLLGTVTILKTQGRSDTQAAPTNTRLKRKVQVGEQAEDYSDKELNAPQRKRALDTLKSIQIPSGGDKAGIAEGGGTQFDSQAEDLFDRIGDPLLCLDGDLTITQVNGEALRTFTEDGAALLGIPIWELFTEDEWSRYEADFCQPMSDGKRHYFEIHDSQRTHWYQVNLYRSFDGMLILLRDMTEQRVSKANEIRQQRLEGLGLLARGFAHDFNNDLTTVTGNIGLAKEKVTDEGVLNMLGEAEKATSRAAGLVQQLMTFAAGGRPVKEPVKIPELLRKVLNEHRIGLPSIRYQFRCTEKQLRACVDRAQVRRVIENLISNAEKAMPNGGTLTLSCSEISASEAQKLRQTTVSVRQDRHFLVEVIDSGIGMTPETVAHAFDPYFSVRESDNATGIGLTVCESIAKAHDGYIQLRSQVNKGTVASFCIPLALDTSHVEWEEMPAHPTLVTSSEKKPNGEVPQMDRSKYRVLVLEDDAPIRSLISATLGREGYQITETAEGSEAILEYEKSLASGKKFDLFISDLTIEGGMGGVETMRRLQKIDPEVLAIVSSGYSDAAAMANPEAFGFRGVIPKPYSPATLKAEVDRIVSKHCL